MATSTPRLNDLVTILYRPRETMRRILEGARRWTFEIVVLACVCSAIAEKNSGGLERLLPDLGPGSSLAIIALFTILALILGSILWILLLFLFGWMVSGAGRWLGGAGRAADVRAALAWSLVPLIWGVIYKVPMAIYSRRFAGIARSDGGVTPLLEFVDRGGCAVAVVTIVVQIALFVWVLFIAGSTVAEAMTLSTPQGFGAIAIAAFAPVVIAIAAVLAFKSS